MEVRFKIGENVAVNFGYAGAFGACKVTGIHFTTNKVKYDVEIRLEHESEAEAKQRTVNTTRLYNIDSDFVVSRQEWLDWNQSKPAFEVYHPELLSNVAEEKQSIASFQQAFGYDNPPPVSEQDAPMSEDVLVDMDGNRKHFVIGWYDHSEKEWILRAKDTSLLEPEHAQWMYLPLAKYNRI